MIFRKLLLILMKKLFVVISIASLFAFQGSSPTIKVIEKEEKFENLQRKGFSVLILLEKSIIEKAWFKKVKEFGKIESAKGEYIVYEALMPTISPTQVRFYSKVIEKTKQGTEVWLAVDLGTEFITGKHPKKEELERILYQFAVDVYRADYALQVEEAEATLAKSIKEYERTVANEQKVRGKMEKNADQKQDLLKEIKENKLDSVQLVKDLEMNKLEQSQELTETEKLRKAVEIVKNKMASVK